MKRLNHRGVAVALALIEAGYKEVMVLKDVPTMPDLSVNDYTYKAEHWPQPLPGTKAHRIANRKWRKK